MHGVDHICLETFHLGNTLCNGDRRCLGYAKVHCKWCRLYLYHQQQLQCYKINIKKIACRHWQFKYVDFFIYILISRIQFPKKLLRAFKTFYSVIFSSKVDRKHICIKSTIRCFYIIILWHAVTTNITQCSLQNVLNFYFLNTHWSGCFSVHYGWSFSIIEWKITDQIYII